MSLADFGRKELEMAEVEMPGLYYYLSNCSSLPHLIFYYDFHFVSYHGCFLSFYPSGLMSCRSEFGASQPLKGAKIAGTIRSFLKFFIQEFVVDFCDITFVFV
jgi:hypothetical protein